MTDYATARQLVATLGDKQRLKYKVTPQPGALLPADSLGGQMVALADLFNELGRKDGQPLKTLVSSVNTAEDGTVEFELVIVPLAKPDADKDLLEALEALTARVHEVHKGPSPVLSCEVWVEMKTARAAIAKARGTT